MPPIALFEPKEQFQIRIAGNHFSFVEVIENKQLKWNELINAGYNYLDAGLAENDYFDYLCKKFAGKKWFRKKDSIFNVVFFKRIIQLNLFENNEHLTPEGCK